MTPPGAAGENAGVVLPVEKVAKGMHMGWRSIVGVAIVALMGSAAMGQDKTLILDDFENDADIKLLSVTDGSVSLAAEGVTHGAKSLEVTWDAKKGPVYVHLVKPPEDWSGYDALLLDVLNPGDAVVPGEMAVCDKAWEAKQGYWTRHNETISFAPGKTTWVIPVRGMYPGETGFRNRDIKRDVDPDSIVRAWFGFGGKDVAGKVIIDNLRLVKATPPKGVWALDFGPASQATMLGWTAVSNKSLYSPQAGLGFTSEVLPALARDTAFGPALIRDSVECGGAKFRVDVPEGRYSVMVIYENSGFWGGDQAQCSSRQIEVNGKVAWKSQRPDGIAHALYRFENVEPVNVDIWDTYMAPELAAPVVFETEAGKDGLTMAMTSDNAWGSRVSAVAIYKVGDSDAAAWVKGQMSTLANDFRKLAVCLDKPAQKFDASQQWQKAGLVAWRADLDQDVKPATVPPADCPAPDKLALSRVATLGEYEPFGVAIRPLKDLGECRLRLDGTSGDVEAQIGVVWYGMTRGAGAIAYHVVPQSLRPQTTVSLPKDVTRQIVVTCKVADTAKAGDVNWTLVLSDASGNDILRVPLKLTVHAIKPERQSDFVMGYYGLAAPAIVPPPQRAAVMDQTLAMLKQHGMNGICGAASCKLIGFENGEPKIDFSEMDAFMATVKKHGFVRAINSYGCAVLSGMNDGYEIGETGKRMAQQAGVSFDEALMRAWKVIDEHARKADWPMLYACLCDETRIRAECERELEFMSAMSKVSAAFPKTLRTDGAYSVTFNERPEDKDNLLYWHQRYFQTLDVSTLNLHDETVLAEGAKTGKRVNIYNQGLSRYSFGLYQWSEYRKGVSARWQWHLNDLYGYQFFELDGWSDDYMMIYYGKNGIYPAVAFERCREGAEDFYLYQTLWNLIHKGSGSADARQKAQTLLEGAVGKLKVNQRQAPEGLDLEQLKAQVVASIEELTAK